MDREVFAHLRNPRDGDIPIIYEGEMIYFPGELFFDIHKEGDRVKHIYIEEQLDYYINDISVLGAHD